MKVNSPDSRDNPDALLLSLFAPLQVSSAKEDELREGFERVCFVLEKGRKIRELDRKVEGNRLQKRVLRISIFLRAIDRFDSTPLSLSIIYIGGASTV
jgi:hypothetical protein